MPTRTVLATIASALDARRNCLATGNTEWEARHLERAMAAVHNHLPSGSGFDYGTRLEVDLCTARKIVFTTSFHHMDDGGYAGWTEHDVIVTPAFDGFDLRVTGRDRNDVKDYIGEVFHSALSALVTE